MDTKIAFGGDLSREIAALIKGKDSFTITDSNVEKLYGSLLSGARYAVIPAGEKSKNLDTLEEVESQMLKSGCNRFTTVIALGGGVVGDLAGFAAATFMRGVDWIGVPTTLLAQVDSSVGGKTAVDVGSYKNVIGAFHLPREVIISAHFLRSLQDREWLCGLGEIVKTAFLSREVASLVLPHLDRLLSRDESAILPVVRECVEYKKRVVAADYRENGQRKNLNLGHTIGHALESVDGYRRSHGEYVLFGLLAETYALGGIIESEIADTIRATVRKTLSHVEPIGDISEQAVLDACAFDKKNSGDGISVIVPAYEKTHEAVLDREQILRGLKEWKSSL